MQIAIGLMLVLALGGLGAVVCSMQLRSMRVAREQLRQNPVPGARRRFSVAIGGFVSFLLFEGAIYALGAAFGNAALGAGVAVGVLVLSVIALFVWSVRDEQRRGNLP